MKILYWSHVGGRNSAGAASILASISRDYIAIATNRIIFIYLYMREGMNVAANLCFSVSDDITDVGERQELLVPDQHQDLQRQLNASLAVF